MSEEKFQAIIQAGYSHKGESITLGAAMLGGNVVSDCLVKLLCYDQKHCSVSGHN